MNLRRSVLLTAIAALLLIAALLPAARLLEASKDALLDGKQKAIAAALESFEMHQSREPAVAVQPMMDIEDVWAIEDARKEAAGELVTAMYNGADELGYDAQSRTFYCTLGMDRAEDWPPILLRARGAEGVNLVWIDDYSYDFCADAIRNNYRYELMAYTQEEFAYIGVVFTGLPIVTLHTDGETGDADSPARVTVSAAGYDAVDSAVVIHERGGKYPKPIDKRSYRIEMHALGANGKDEKRMEALVGMPADSDWLLLSNACEPTALRNKLAWDVWNDWHPDGKGPMKMENELVEVFVNDTYKGIYQLMQRVNEERDILALGGNLDTDVVVRMISPINPSEKPTVDLYDEAGYILEYRYEPNGNAERAFALSKDHAKLSRHIAENQLSDEEFAELALERVDIPSLMDYILFFHVCTLRDNVFNNIYIYSIQQEDGSYRYYHGPWDMDLAFWVLPADAAPDAVRYLDTSMPLPHRMLDLNVGNCREVIWNLWKEKRETILSDEAMEKRFFDMEEYVNASGAYLRESQTYYGEAIQLNLSDISYYNQRCIETTGQMLEYMWPLESQQSSGE